MAIFPALANVKKVSAVPTEENPMSLSLSNRIGLGVLIAGLLCVVTLFGGIAYMAFRQDDQALSSETQMINGGLNAMRQPIKTFTQDYAWWPDLLIAVNKADVEWMTPNLGMAVFSNKSVDITFVLDRAGAPVAAWDTSTGETSDTSVVDPAVSKLVVDIMAQRPAGKVPAEILFCQFGGKPAIIAFTRIFPAGQEGLDSGGKLPLLVMGNYLTDSRVAELGSTFLINDLKLEHDAVPSSIPIMTAADRPLGFLRWTSAKSGTATLRKAVLPIAGLALAALLAAVLLGNLARRNAARLAEAEAKAKLETAKAQGELDAKAKLAQLGQLAATVAHEIRNPLAVVRTSAFLLTRKLMNKGVGVESQIEHINRGITRCDDIITQLLDYTRSQELSRTSTPLNSWLIDIVEEYAKQLPDLVKVKCIVGMSEITVPLDASRMQRAIENLIRNASEALVGKSQDVKISANACPLITIETRFTPRGAEISVTDNGPGIAPEVLGRVLEPLFTTKSFGTGLGLPAVANTLERHGGGLDIVSELGKGARFTAWLPLETVAVEPNQGLVAA
jgi:signal transduction histidine kinase